MTRRRVVGLFVALALVALAAGAALALFLVKEHPGPYESPFTAVEQRYLDRYDRALGEPTSEQLYVETEDVDAVIRDGEKKLAEADKVCVLDVDIHSDEVEQRFVDTRVSWDEPTSRAVWAAVIDYCDGR